MDGTTDLQDAIVVAKFTGRYPHVGVSTVELRNHAGRIQAMAPADVELVRPASAEHKVLRHGTEEQFQAQVEWDCQEHPTVGGWLSSPRGACWLAAGPTQDKLSGSTDLHSLCSNPMITISMLTAVHRRRALTEGKDSVKPFDDGPYLALHVLVHCPAYSRSFHSSHSSRSHHQIVQLLMLPRKDSTWRESWRRISLFLCVCRPKRSYRLCDTLRDSMYCVDRYYKRRGQVRKPARRTKHPEASILPLVPLRLG